MNLEEGATHEITSRWPEYKQRNVALVHNWYGPQFYSDMITGIQLVRDHHDELTKAGATTWSIPTELAQLLDELASAN